MSERPDYAKLINQEQVDEEIASRKDVVCSKAKLHGQTKQQKKDSNAAFNETLKFLQEELDQELEIIDELNRRKKELDGTRVMRLQQTA